MRVTIVHQFVPPEAPADERDVLDQVAAVRAALESLGHAVAVLPCTTDLGNLWRKLTLQVPDAVFNLVESLDGSGRLLHLAPALWETHGLPFTGCPADALYLTTHKLLAKERMAAAGLPTPAWIADGAAHGVVKVLTVPGKDRILGVTIVGEHAGDLLAEMVLAMRHGLGLNKVLGTIHTYPTLAESNKYVAGEWKRAHAPARVLAWLERYHAWRRG
jgi:hypothetical protein